MATTIPWDATRIAILCILLLSISSAVYFLFATKRVQVGNRFLIPLRILFIVFVIWQCDTLAYVCVDSESHLGLILNVSRVLCGNIVGSYGVWFGVLVLEAFKILTNISVVFAGVIRTVSILLAVLSTMAKVMKTLYPNTVWNLAYLLLVTAAGLYSVAFDLSKSVYLLRLLYQDALRINGGSSSQSKNLKKRYMEMRLIIYPIVSLCALNAIMWGIGVAVGSELLIDLGQSCVGIQTILYPRLIISYRKLRFDKTLAMASGLLNEPNTLVNASKQSIMKPKMPQNTPNHSNPQKRG